MIRKKNDILSVSKGSASCCGSDACCSPESSLYPVNLLTTIPSDVANTS